MSLPRFGVTRPVPVNLLMAALLLAGGWCAITVRREFFPEIDPQAATVSLPYPGATPEEIEETLAIKVEDKLVDLDEIDTMRTTISENGGGIIVEFREEIRDVGAAVDEVERAVDSLLDLPEDAEKIQVAELEARLPVIMMSVYGDVDEEVLKQTIRDIKDDLQTLPGMGEVLISGVRDYEVRVDVDAVMLLEHGISLPEVAATIRAWMADVPGGSVRSALGNVNVRTIGVEERSEAIREIVLRAGVSGHALRVGDIASVRESFVDEQIITRFNSKPSSSLTVFKVGDQDIVKMARMSRAYVDAREGRPFVGRGVDAFLPSDLRTAYETGASASPLPLGCAIATHSDLARFVEGRLGLLTKNALYGAVLVFGTLLIFLNWRVALWVAVGLVTALAGTLVLMKTTGITLNLLTMFGLIVVLGILVDDAIVVAENIQARHDRGDASLVAAVRGAEEVAWPVVATVLTTIVAFLPLTFIKGQIGDLLGALPTVVTCALIMSLVEGLLILPSHMGHSLADRDRHRPGRLAGLVRRGEQGRDKVILERVVPAYARLLKLSLRFRYISIATAVATLIISLGMVAGGRLDFVFLPADDSETVVVDLRLPLGTSIERTGDVVAMIERAARLQEESKSVSAVIGQRANLETGITDASATHLAQVFIELKPVEQRNRPASEVIASIRETLGPVEDVENIRYEEVVGGPSGPDITLEIKGADIEQLRLASAAIKRELLKFAGVLEVYDDDAIGQRELQIRLKHGAAALGFKVNDVAAQVRGALFGLDAHVFSDKQEDIDVRVRMDVATRRNLRAIENLWLISPTGRRVPLMEIAELTDGDSYATIKRIDRNRAITVTAETYPEVSPEGVTGVFGRDMLPALQGRFPDVDIRFAGRQEQMKDAFSSLPLGFLAALVMIYVILAWLFSSYVLPIAVMLAIPFGMIGVVWGHFLLGFDLTFLSLIGSVALSGIVVNDSLILMQFYIQRRADGLSLQEALVEAGRRRLRPIFLTTITTVFGLTPLMLEQSFQARFLIPMAISISFGLMSATVLILLVLPCIVVIVDDLKRLMYFSWHGRPLGERHEPRSVADAVAE